MIFTFYLPHFSNIFSNRFFMFSLSHLNIFLHSLFIHFLTHVFPHPIPTPFFTKFLLRFILLLMNSSTSGLENDCSLVKNFLSFKEAVGARFSSFSWFYSLYFGFTYSIRDALTYINSNC